MGVEGSFSLLCAAVSLRQGDVSNLLVHAARGRLPRVQITDIVAGDGPVADAGKGVTLKWVMRRSNGYYVSSSEEGGGEPFIYRVSEKPFREKAEIHKQRSMFSLILFRAVEWDEVRVLISTAAQIYKMSICSR